jgi:hypothetical protein
MFEGDKIAARFAVMNHSEKDKVFDPKLGGMGFLEMVDDQDVADGFIAFAKDWHAKRGYKAFRGPVNFGENDSFWGLLVENFDEPLSTECFIIHLITKHYWKIPALKI